MHCYYRRDSDIFAGYGTSANSIATHHVQQTEFVPFMNQLISSKTGLAVWIVSNCRIVSGAKKRMSLFLRLVAEGLKVEKRGKCFSWSESTTKKTKHDIIKEHKFYLSFENQLHCKDYITEKLFKNAFANGAVPVVYGGTRSDYEEIAPPGSYIFAEDFTPAELVNYLNYLDRNSTAYAEYFRWRTYRPEQMHDFGRQNYLCQLCRTLHGINIDNIYNPLYHESYEDIPLFDKPGRQRTVPSLRKFFYGEENRDCLPVY